MLWEFSGNIFFLMDYFTLIYGLFIFLIGASIGSFLNVLIYRLPLGKSIVHPRSFCPACGNRLLWYHNVPVLAWLVLRGRCAFCGEGISFRYFFVELLNGAFYLVIFLSALPIANRVTACLLFSILLAVFFIDLAHKIIPDSLNVAILVLGLGSAWFRWHGWHGFLLAGSGILLGLVLFLLTGLLGKWLFKKEALGGGDVKLLAALGAIIGPVGVIEVVFMSAFIGLLTTIPLSIAGKIDKVERQIPYGPFIAIAAMISFIFDEPVVRFYLSILNL